MKCAVVIVLFCCMLFSCTPSATERVEDKIIAMEMEALERWGKGDPSGFLDLSAADVVYFDPVTENRLDGHEELTKLYEGLRGKIQVDSIHMPNPKVQVSNDMAVLTYNLISFSGGKGHGWNCTEVFRLRNNEWKIIQTHWSLTKPELKESE